MGKLPVHGYEIESESAVFRRKMLGYSSREYQSEIEVRTLSFLVLAPKQTLPRIDPIFFQGLRSFMSPKINFIFSFQRYRGVSRLAPRLAMLIDCRGKAVTVPATPSVSSSTLVVGQEGALSDTP